jgi:ADP-heptose:LPS heptosyltransferase
MGLLQAGNKMSGDQDVIERLMRRYYTQDLLFSVFDAVLGRALGKKESAHHTVVGNPERVLIANIGRIGDVIISTAILPVLKGAFPGVEIGFLASSWGRQVLENHPLLNRVHYFDHWRLSGPSALHHRITQHRRERKRVIKELQTCKYDVAIDLRAWFPNSVTLLSAARIPIRIGYNRLGFGPLLTHPLSYHYDRRHELEHQLDLLGCLSVSSEAASRAWPILPPVSKASRMEVESLLGNVRRFRVLHPGASTPIKDWPLVRWTELAQTLLEQQITPVLTGRGVRDASLINEIMQAVPGCVNACNKLTWNGLAELIGRAELVYSVDTSVGHVAAALRRPVVAIYGGTADPRHWKPFGASAVAATNELPCHPCFRKKGCSTRTCLTGLSLMQVESAAQEALQRTESVWLRGDRNKPATVDRATTS